MVSESTSECPLNTVNTVRWKWEIQSNQSKTRVESSSRVNFQTPKDKSKSRIKKQEPSPHTSLFPLGLIPDPDPRSVFSVLCDKKLFLSRVSFPASSVPPQFRTLSFAFFCYKLMNTDVANSVKGLCLLNISYITYYIIHNNIKQFKNWKIDTSPYRLL